MKTRWLQQCNGVMQAEQVTYPSAWSIVLKHLINPLKVILHFPELFIKSGLLSSAHNMDLIKLRNEMDSGLEIYMTCCWEL